MAQITFNIPDAISVEILDAFCAANDYRNTIVDANGNDIPNPETKQQFAKRTLRQIYTGPFRNQKSIDAANNALEQVESQIG